MILNSVMLWGLRFEVLLCVGADYTKHFRITRVAFSE
jgi:hypothetical protein